METNLIVIFLGFTCVLMLTNALLIWLAYKCYTDTVGPAVQTATEFAKSNSTRAVVNSLQTASEHAKRISEAAKERITGYGPVMDQARQEWGSALATIDAQFEDVEAGISKNVRKVRDAVAKPAFQIEAIAEGIQGVLGFINSTDGGGEK